MDEHKDNPHVSTSTFNQFKIDQASLCKSYRSHLDTKIDNMEGKIKWSVYLTGAAITTVLALLNWYLNLVG